MKRRLIVFLCIFCILSGCGLAGESLGLTEPGFALQGAEQEQVEFHAVLYSDGEPAILWGREQLTGHAQEAYDQISRAAASRQETPVTVDVGESEIQMILTALRMDHPEYFWFDGQASFVTTTVAGVELKTECTLSYTMDLPEIQEAHQGIQQYTAACLSKLAQEGAETDYEKILGVYRYIIGSTDYVESEEDQSIVSAMVSCQATCAGYARSFQYLMNQLGIPCTLALGEGAAGEAHGWNVVQCGGSWYQVDVTWGDPVEPDGSPGDSIQYTYCMVTDREIYRDHTLVSDVPVPVCTDTAYNYYIQSGRQMDEWSLEAYGEKLDQAAEQGERWFSVRFSNWDAYEEAVYQLFTEEQIWDVLRSVDGETQVVYSQNDMFYEISVRLDGDSEGDAT